MSLGAGVNAQYLHVTLSNAVDSGSVCLGSAPNNEVRAQCLASGLVPGDLSRDGFGEVDGDSWAFNFNAGLLYKFNDATRVGLAYRSKITHDAEGEATFDVDPGLQQFLTAAGSNAFTETDIKGTAKLPSNLSLSIAHQLDPKIQILADVTWTEWSTFQELRIEYDNPDQPDSVTTENWDDVIRYSLGVNYQHSDKLTLRGGIAFDEEPIPNENFRTPRIPGNDRLWVAFGAGYQLDGNKSFDLGYAHLFVDETAIDHTDESLGHTTRGLYESSVDILSAQFNWKFN